MKQTDWSCDSKYWKWMINQNEEFIYSSPAETTPQTATRDLEETLSSLFQNAQNENTASTANKTGISLKI